MLLVVLLGPARMVESGPPSTIILTFELEEFDLDAGIASEADILTDNTGWDFRFGYNADRLPHAVLLQNEFSGVEIAFMDSIPFDTVVFSDVADLTFTTGFIDQPFDNDDSVVLRTDTGDVFKIGNLVEDDTAVTFDYQKLEETISSNTPAMNGSSVEVVTNTNVASAVVLFF